MVSRLMVGPHRKKTPGMHSSESKESIKDKEWRHTDDYTVGMGSRQTWVTQSAGRGYCGQLKRREKKTLLDAVKEWQESIQELRRADPDYKDLPDAYQTTAPR